MNKFEVPANLAAEFKIRPLADVYKAGPCPECGEFAVGTWRTPFAPVYCRNGHMWKRTFSQSFNKDAGIRG